MASVRYARLMSASDAPGGTPSARNGSPLKVMSVEEVAGEFSALAAGAVATCLADLLGRVGRQVVAPTAAERLGRGGVGSASRTC